MKLSIVIPSRNRANSITTAKLLKSAVVVCPESQVEEYRKNVSNEIIAIPDAVKGLGKTRNYILDNFKEDIIVMADDDITCAHYIGGAHYKAITDPEELEAIIWNAAVMATDAGVKCFGFGQTPDVRKYDPSQPFSFTGWVGGVIGVIGKEKSFIDNYFKVDVDFCLQCLLEDRIIFKDNRYCFVQVRDRNSGGNSMFRTKKLVEKEKQILKNKWGKHIKFTASKTGDKCSIDVPRRENYAGIVY